MSTDKFKTAQHVIPNADGMAMSGFNHRVLGDSYQETFAYPQRPSREMYAGWQLAEDMVRAGKIYFVHKGFHSTHDKNGCNGYAFSYGGSMVCNTCGRNNLEEDWWKIKVIQDGDAWICVGIDFENIQESDCYAFGDTREAAIKNYGDLMLAERSKP